MAVVYVISASGKPLMPTTRCGHVRGLLNEGKARVVEREPFTIQLKYETPDVTQPLYLGIDPGRTNVGAAVVCEDGECVFTAQLTTRNKDVPKLMKARKQFRMAHRRLKRRCKRQRRAKAAGTLSQKGEFQRLLPGYEKPILCKGIRNKEARFNNRQRPVGWLTPTANHLLLTHLNMVKKLQKLLPITDVVLEVNRFAFMAMENSSIRRWQYQRGPLYGKDCVEDAVYAQQDGHCLCVGLCNEHHDLVHKDRAWEAKMKETKAGLNKKYHALSVLNQIIPALTEQLTELFPQHAFVTTGKDTADFREDHGIAKEHYLDAYCIACSVLTEPDRVSAPTAKPYRLMQFRRHDRQVCHKENIKRVYLLDGKAVATNRHKAIEQKDDSLEEFRRTHTQQEVSSLTVKDHQPIYKDMQRFMPGGVFLCNGKVHTLLGSQGRYKGMPYYYIGTDGSRNNATRCIFLQQNCGLRWV